MTQTADFLVIGAGIAGASAAAELARDGSVILLERESQPGYHSTGRSAAVYTENYGTPAIRRLAKASKPTLADPPDDLAEGSLLSPRGVVFIARPDQVENFEKMRQEAEATAAGVVAIGAGDLTRLHDGLAPGYADRALHEPDAMDIDVHGLHSGFLRQARARGTTLVTNAGVTAVTKSGDSWSVTAGGEDYSARVVVNAAGAWADEIAALADVTPIGLQPKRRTAVTFDPPVELITEAWPICADVDEGFYFKPDAGRILASPADATPVPPQDVQPEELDVAIAVDRIETATIMRVPRLASKWAGLRSFVADGTPVVGMAPDADGFLWLAGQGGYGIKTSPAMARLAAAAATGRPIPDDIDVTEAEIGPGRLR